MAWAARTAASVVSALEALAAAPRRLPSAAMEWAIRAAASVASALNALAAAPRRLPTGPLGRAALGEAESHLAAFAPSSKAALAQARSTDQVGTVDGRTSCFRLAVAVAADAHRALRRQQVAVQAGANWRAAVALAAVAPRS